MSAPVFAVVADDLTGASDSGVQFARRGYETAVLFCGEGRSEGGWDVIVMDTDSRSVDCDEAEERVFEAASQVGGAGVVYKKIDSTLRGNISVEVRAMMVATGRSKAVVAPAFPAAGRTTLGGVQLVNGRPVHETEAARDPKTPVTQSDLASMLSNVGEVRVIDTKMLEDEERVRGIARGCDLMVSDATEEDHLTKLVEAIEDPSEYLWVGAAGLAGALCDALEWRGERGDEGTVRAARQRTIGGNVIRNGRPALIAVGSLSGASRGQLAFLRKCEGVSCVPLDDPQIAQRSARESLAAGKSTVVHSGTNTRELSPSRVVGMFSEIVAELSYAGAFGGLVLTGGDTAVAVARGLGARGLRLVEEVEPGVPLGVLIGPMPYLVATKAGGFGGPHTLASAAGELSDMLSGGIGEVANDEPE